MSNDIKNDNKDFNNKDLVNNNEVNKEVKLNYNDNMNLELNNIQKLNENIKENLSEENNNIYNRINNFLNEEYNSLNKRMNDLNNTNYINNQLKTLRESNHLKKYRNIFSNIYEKEQKKSEDISYKITKSKNNLDKIRKECNSLFNQINSGLINPELINQNFKNVLNDIDEYNNNKNNYNINNINEYQLRKSSSMDNRINKKYYINNRYNINKTKISEENKEDNDNINYITFPVFCNSYEPYYLSEKINNNFSHNFFNFKKNYSDIKFKLITSKLI